MKRVLLAAAVLATALAAPASAQYGGGYGGGYGGRAYDDDDDYVPRRRPPPSYERPYGPPGNNYGPRPGPYGQANPYGQPGYGRPAQRLGSICVTARGNCPWRPSPTSSPCGCNIPGFGFKRGAVGGSFAY